MTEISSEGAIFAWNSMISSGCSPLLSVALTHDMRDHALVDRYWFVDALILVEISILLILNQSNITQMKKVFTILLPALLVFAMADAQIKTPQPSPTGSFTQSAGLTEFTVDYSRPGVKERVIFAEDGLVPYGKIWRTGANAATTIEFSEDINFGGKDVEAGKYALYTIPGKETWSVMLYSDLTLGGNVGNYDEANEVAKVTVDAYDMGEINVQSFTIMLGNLADASCTLDFIWASTFVAVPIELNTAEQIDGEIQKFAENPMADVAGNYLSAGWYMYNNDGDMAQANEFMQKGCEYSSSPFKFFWMNRASQVQAAAGDYSGAVATAKAAHKEGMSAPDNAKGFYESTVKGELDANIEKWGKM